MQNDYVHVPCQWCNDTGLLDLYYVKDTYCLNCDTGKKLAGIEPVVTTTSMEFGAHPDDTVIRHPCLEKKRIGCVFDKEKIDNMSGCWHSDDWTECDCECHRIINKSTNE